MLPHANAYARNNLFWNLLSYYLQPALLSGIASLDATSNGLLCLSRGDSSKGNFGILLAWIIIISVFVIQLYRSSMP